MQGVKKLIKIFQYNFKTLKKIVRKIQIKEKQEF